MNRCNSAQVRPARSEIRTVQVGHPIGRPVSTRGFVMVDLSFVLFCCAGMAAMATVLDAVMPPGARPWWGSPRRRFAITKDWQPADQFCADPTTVEAEPARLPTLVPRFEQRTRSCHLSARTGVLPVRRPSSVPHAATPTGVERKQSGQSAAAACGARYCDRRVDSVGPPLCHTSSSPTGSCPASGLRLRIGTAVSSGMQPCAINAS